MRQPLRHRPRARLRRHLRVVWQESLLRLPRRFWCRMCGGRLLPWTVQLQHRLTRLMMRPHSRQHQLLKSRRRLHRCHPSFKGMFCHDLLHFRATGQAFRCCNLQAQGGRCEGLKSAQLMVDLTSTHDHYMYSKKKHLVALSTAVLLKIEGQPMRHVGLQEVLTILILVCRATGGRSDFDTNCSTTAARA